MHPIHDIHEVQAPEGAMVHIPRDSSAVHVSAPRFINRDLSLIEFFRRVLEEAQDGSQPLLERLKFISILSSNLDEFFMIRVAGLKERLGAGTLPSDDGYTPVSLLKEIRHRVSRLVAEQHASLRSDILPRLAREGVVVRRVSELAEDERRYVDEYFDRDIYPLLTPQAVDPSHPFPYISAGSVNIGLYARPRLHKRTARALKNVDEMFFRLKLPQSVPALIPIGDGRTEFVFLEDLVSHHIERLVPGSTAAACHYFRITRDADIELRESEAEDLLESMEENLRLRRFGSVVRLEVSGTMPDRMVAYLQGSLDVDDDDVYKIDGPLDTGSLSGLYKLDRPDLKDRPIRSAPSPMLPEGAPMFDAIGKGDILLHHPYNPYSVITDFIQQSVDDPDVLAIKMCLYRIGAESPIAPLLIRASELGKQVTVLIEIKARFDEANNIEWARRLEEAGVHVVYGHIGLKTHCKTTLIVRRENDKLVRYVHVATGNYNHDTSPFYTDISLLTADPGIGADATELFNYLTAYSQRGDFDKLIVAPITLRERMLFFIRNEAENARRGLPSGIRAKMNRLADSEIIDALYDASNAGVRIDLIVRGVCTLRPGVPGLSENITVRSVVGRLLEHSRVYYFENAGDPTILTGSADWMPRNLDRRIEVLAPVTDPQIKRYLADRFLATYLSDNSKAREMQPDGSYRRVPRSANSAEIDSQLAFEEPANIVRFERPGSHE